VKRPLLGAAALMLMGQAPAPEPAAAPAPAAIAPGANPTARPAPWPLTQPTPMAERVVTVAILNKNNSQARDFKLRPGGTVRFERLTVRVRACEATPPWERPWSGAFVQIDDQPRRGATKRVFSGWLFAESPSINSFDHPVYDVWVKSCAMSFPEIGPDTIVAGRPASAAKPAASDSSAKKSPSTDSAASSDDR
jgi:hypothetical protein